MLGYPDLLCDSHNMEDEDRLLAGEISRDIRGASSLVLLTETDPIKLLQNDMHTMATSMQKMSDAWSQIAVQKETDSVKRKNKGTSKEDSIPKKIRKDTVSDSEYSSCEGESCVSSNSNDSDIEGLVKSKNCSHERKEGEAKKGEKSALLDEISQEFDINEKGPKIDDSVAKVVNKRWKGKMNIKILREKMNKYPVPENCDNLLVPRINNPVWKNLDRYHRTQDLKFVNTKELCCHRIGTCNVFRSIRCSHDDKNAFRCC